MDMLDIGLRLVAATLLGAAIGINRDLRGKPIGVRILALVGLGSATAVLAISEGSLTDASRVVQGIVTGIGFLGAGAIIRSNRGHEVHGLTTAACTWLAACAGAACGIAEWQVILLSTPLMFLVLVLGGPLEEAIHRRWPGHHPDDEA